MKAAAYRYRVGIDVGGTFTDFCLFDAATGQLVHHKVPSTPRDPSAACLRGLEELAGRHGISVAEIDFLAHGTTVVTNAILQSRFARFGIITTRGFRDVLEIGDQTRPRTELYNPHVVKPPPLIPRYLRHEVAERLNYAGEVLVPLDEEAVRDAARALAAEGVEGVVIAFLFSYLNPVHERRAAELVREVDPRLKVILSSEVLPVVREYDRFVTATLNAALAPLVDRYLHNFEQRLKALGLRTDLKIMHSGGGLLSAAEARNRCLHLALSGPAAGIIGVSHLGKLTGHRNLIGFDMGGTSCDIGLIADGQTRLTTEAEINAYPIRFAMADIHSIGAGGGSIAWIDSGGALRVGPQSAGAEPGPIAYDQGGVEPTVTDANLVLGRISPDYFLGGSMRLSLERARQGIEAAIARPLGLTVTEAAAGIVEVVNANMLRALKVISVERGYDPRDFTLVPFGGAGALHAGDIAEELEIGTILVPETPGTLSAFGLLVADVRHDFSRSLPRAEAGRAERMEAAYAEMAALGRESLLRDGIPAEAVVLQRFAEMRYVGQSYQLTVAVPDGAVNQALLAAVAAAFHREHERRYGYAAPDEPIEVVNLRLTAVGRIPALSLAEYGGGPDQPLGAAVKGQREVFFGRRGWQRCTVYDRYLLRPGHRLAGPAIVEQRESTTVINPGQEAVVDRWRNLVIRTAGSRS